MSDYMKEAERLLDELRTCTLAEATHYASPDFKRAKASEEAANRARAALLAHIQRGAVLEGWKEATIAWEVCASIHREYAKKKDPFFTTRQADFVRHTEAARAAMLAAAPAPAPAEAPMPKPVAYGFGNTAITGHTNRLMMVRIDIPGGDQYAGAFWLPLVLADEAHTYGNAREAAGYARGLKEADKLLQALRDIADPIAAYERDLPPGYKLDGAACVRMADNPETYRSMAREAIAALRGEVKP